MEQRSDQLESLDIGNCMTNNECGISVGRYNDRLGTPDDINTSFSVFTTQSAPIETKSVRIEQENDQVLEMAHISQVETKGK